MRPMRRRGPGPFGRNLALALLAAGAIVSLATAPAAQSPPAGPPPFAPPATTGPAPSALDGGAPPTDGGAAPTAPRPGASPSPLPSGAPSPSVTPPPPSAAAGGSPEGGASQAESSGSSAAPGSADPAPPAGPAAAGSSDPASGGGGRILDPAKIYVSIPVALGVSAGVNFAMGIAFTVLSNAKVAKTEGIWRELQADGGRGACNKPAFAARCDDLYGADSDRRTYRNVAVLSYVGAVGFAVGAGVSYFILFKGSEGKESAGGASGLVVDIGPSGGGAAIKGTF